MLGRYLALPSGRMTMKATMPDTKLDATSDSTPAMLD